MLGTREVQQAMAGQAMAVATYSPASRSRPLLVKRYLLSRRWGLERSKTRQALERDKGDIAGSAKHNNVGPLIWPEELADFFHG